MAKLVDLKSFSNDLLHSTLSDISSLNRHDVISCLDVQPDDHFDFYGFSRYARELNELTPDIEAVLPPTDTRFRPDQRYNLDFYSSKLKMQ